MAPSGEHTILKQNKINYNRKKFYSAGPRSSPPPPLSFSIALIGLRLLDVISQEVWQVLSLKPLLNRCQRKQGIERGETGLAE
jgi:hypothetical protein